MFDLQLLISDPIWTALSAFVVAAALFQIYRRIVGRKMDQAFRDDGPAHHKEKGHVPTGAGVVFIIVLFVAGIVAIPWALEEGGARFLGIYICWVAALMGLLGLVDDRYKVLNGSAGLRARFKFPVQVLIGLLFLGLLYSIFGQITAEQGWGGLAQPWPMTAPWWLFFPIGLFVWLGAVNGANFTDGLDGLLSCTTLVLLAGAFVALLDTIQGVTDPISLPAAVGFGVLSAFLIYNWKPARLYMGDSGSLAVGALVAGLFLAKGWWLFLGLCAIVWVLEVASVMLQVAVFRATSKRVFLMSPLHHHFELAGWGERRTVMAFTALQIVGSLTAFAWLRYGLGWGLLGLTVLLATVAVLLLKYNKRVR